MTCNFFKSTSLYTETSEKRLILKALITAEPVLNYLDTKSSTIALRFGFLSKRLVLVLFIKL
jgi:hypothetical protein